jgi:hypothetical protein
MEKLIEEMKAWCLENYDKGADTMVECWDTEDYVELIQGCTPEQAWDYLKSIAAVYYERQCDARTYREVY